MRSKTINIIPAKPGVGSSTLAVALATRYGTPQEPVLLVAHSLYQYHDIISLAGGSHSDDESTHFENFILTYTMAPRIADLVERTTRTIRLNSASVIYDKSGYLDNCQDDLFIMCIDNHYRSLYWAVQHTHSMNMYVCLTYADSVLQHKDISNVVGGPVFQVDYSVDTARRIDAGLFTSRQDNQQYNDIFDRLTSIERITNERSIQL